MKRQKHYTSQAEIDKDVDRAKRDIKRHIEAAEAADKAAKERIALNNPLLAEEIEWYRGKAKMLRGKASRIESTRLVKLKRLSAAFNTAMLPGVSTDNSVVLENL